MVCRGILNVPSNRILTMEGNYAPSDIWENLGTPTFNILKVHNVYYLKVLIKIFTYIEYM